MIEREGLKVYVVDADRRVQAVSHTCDEEYWRGYPARGTWNTFFVDLSPYAGKTVQLLFEAVEI